MVPLLVHLQDHYKKKADPRHLEAIQLLTNCVFNLINENKFPGDYSRSFIERLFHHSADTMDEDHLILFAKTCQNSSALYAIASCLRKKVSPLRRLKVLVYSL
jgi:hypothetical protein